MTDLRDVECLTVEECESMRERVHPDSDAARALDRGDVAVAALRNDYRKRLVYQKWDIEQHKKSFCETTGLTPKQAEQLGIFGEGT